MMNRLSFLSILSESVGRHCVITLQSPFTLAKPCASLNNKELESDTHPKTLCDTFHYILRQMAFFTQYLAIVNCEYISTVDIT